MIRQLRQCLDPWMPASTTLVCILLAPIIALLYGISRTGPEWDHVIDTVLGNYIGNTLILILTVSLLSILFAIPTAWLVALYEFPGRKYFEWALILPLAVPTYIAAFTYIQIPEMAIPLFVLIKNNLGMETYLATESLLRYGLLSILLAAVLYPYLYISARASFSRQQRTVIEAAQILGKKPHQIFYQIALPLARPACVAGLSLIVMEVINDYGAVHFFGVPTLTEGIFRTWFGLGDRDSSIRLAGIIMLIILVALLLESLQRGRARFVEDADQAKPFHRRQLSGSQAMLATLLCLVPLSIGFIFPVIQLGRWAFLTHESSLVKPFTQITHSLLLAFATATALTCIALILVYTRKLHPFKWFRSLNRIATMGYAVPGAVLALGVMLCLGWMDRQMHSLHTHMHWPDVFISGTLTAIFFAYMVRFMAVAYQPLQAGMNRICGSLDEASRTLGKSPIYTLWHVNLPLLKNTLLAATMLVFVDILKELPLTLILRPANFDTLATIAFGMAKEGKIHDTAIPSLIIIAIGALGLIVLNRFMSDKYR